MSRGLGTRQRRLLVSLAAIAEGRAQGASPGKDQSGASVFEVLTLWSRLDSLPRQAFDRANLHRGLRALAARGLVAYTDAADYTPRCVCYHAPADHHQGVGWCRPCFMRRRRCRQYRRRPTPRPRWRIGLTPAGAQLVSHDDTAPLVKQWHALQRARQQALAAWAGVK
jgi:hypothetical protein